MRNDEVLKLVKTVNDIALGAPISDEMLGDIKQWVRLEEEHGSNPSVTAIIKALVRELEEARKALAVYGQQSISTATTTTNSAVEDAPKRSRAKRDVPVEDAPPEQEPASEAALGEEEAPAEELPPVEEEQQQEAAVSAPSGDEW